MTDVRADGERFTRPRDRKGDRVFRTEATCAKALRWEKHSIPKKMKGQHRYKSMMREEEIAMR